MQLTFTLNKTRHSTSGYITILANGDISCFPQNQRSILLSTTESEYIADCEGVKELVWMVCLYNDLRNSKIISNFFIKESSKFHFIREKFSEKLFNLEYVPSNKQLADILTMVLAKQTFQL
uniref:Uncharacterized protein n=1 Tax=Megaselia scalaris TaxID=36166 RepID=T1GS22_MEGSC